MSAKAFPTLALAGLLTAVGTIIAAEPPVLPISQFPAPPTPEAKDVPADATTQPFKPAVRVPAQLPVAAISVLTNLVFDAEVKEQKVAPDVFDANFTFNVTNVSPVEVEVVSVRTSCGCTVAQLPTLPWILAPGQDGSFDVHVDLHGKRGSITKSVFMTTRQGNKTVYVRSIIPDPPAMNLEQRGRNLLIAKADRQAVFKNDCASCHSTPTFGKTGSQLYEAACGICHEGGHRNEMVPDLNIAKYTRDYDYWLHWIANGKDGTLMPGFAKEHGGPLTDAQIRSLAHYLNSKFPNPPGVPAAPTSLNP